MVIICLYYTRLLHKQPPNNECIRLLCICRIFSLRRCARCGSGISSTELIMRAKDLVFHLGCFSCVLCSKNLSTGDMASVRENLLICGDHFEADLLK